MTVNRIIECLPLTKCDGTKEEPCLQQLESAIAQTFEEQGFCHVRYTSVQIINQGDKIIPSFSINMSTFPADWDTYYEDASLAVIDPVFFILVSQKDEDRITYGSWHQIEQKALNDMQAYNLPPEAKSESGRLVVFEKAEEHGLKAVLYILIADEESRTIVLLASDKSHEEMEEELSPELWQNILGTIVHIRYAISGTSNCPRCDKHLRIAGGEKVVINKQQMEILRAYLDQPKLTAKEVGDRINLAETTVNYHLKEIRKKFSMPKMSGYALAEFAKKHKIL